MGDDSAQHPNVTGPGDVHEIGLEGGEYAARLPAMAREQKVESQVMLQLKNGPAAGQDEELLISRFYVFGARPGMDAKERVIAGMGEIDEGAAG